MVQHVVVKQHEQAVGCRPIWVSRSVSEAQKTPMQATDDRLANFPKVADKERGTYNAMMLAMDEAIGRMRKKLTDAGLEQNTFVLFISDNGGPTMPSTAINASRNDPLRGSKRTRLEGGIRVPLALRRTNCHSAGLIEEPKQRAHEKLLVEARPRIALLLRWAGGVHTSVYVMAVRPHSFGLWGGSRFSAAARRILSPPSWAAPHPGTSPAG
jgi:hypothetical protein